MTEKYKIRTDLAMEQRERFQNDNVEVPGVEVEEYDNEELEIHITKVKIKTENGAKIMGKPVGNYITLEVPNLPDKDEDYHREISIQLSEVMGQLIPQKQSRSFLVVGLGNHQVTPDALGPFVIENLHINRHLMKEYGKYVSNNKEVCCVSGMIPGVMGQTGMESVEMIKGVISQTHPDYVIAIDALAARSCRRLNRTIQIADTGIHPGSGVGNYRLGLTDKNLGVPVIGIGVPTVVDAATIVNDTMENLIQALESSETLRGVGVVMQGYSAGEKYALVQELIAPQLHGMFVTPKDIDETVKTISYTISEGLNFYFCGEYA